jgi:hypothetical protein
MTMLNLVMLPVTSLIGGITLTTELWSGKGEAGDFLEADESIVQRVLWTPFFFIGCMFAYPYMALEAAVKGDWSKTNYYYVPSE